MPMFPTVSCSDSSQPAPQKASSPIIHPVSPRAATTVRRATTIAPPGGRYSHAIELPANARMVFASGQVGVDKKGKPAQVAVTGSYSPSSFRMIADVNTTMAGAPISAKFYTDARRLGDACPAGAKSG